MTTLYYSHADCLNHDTGPAHPETAARLRAIDTALSSADFAKLVRVAAPLPDDIEAKLALIHGTAMIAAVISAFPTAGLVRFAPTRSGRPDRA